MSAEMPKMPEPASREFYFCSKCGANGYGPAGLHNRRDGIQCSYASTSQGPYYTADQMREYAQEAARQAMERCAEVCESRITGGIPLTRASNDFDCEAMACANAIRALIPQDPDHLAGVGNMVDGKDQSEKRHG